MVKNISFLFVFFLFFIGYFSSDADDTIKKLSKGKILVEYWREQSFLTLKDFTTNPKYPLYPDERSYVTSFEIPKNQEDFYATRIRGFIYPPESGEYTFFLAADDCGELWLSTNEESDLIQKIIELNNWTDYQQWDKYPEQKSKSIRLEKGKKYYIEALQKEVGGGDNLSVGWQLPSGMLERPILGTNLSSCPIVEQKAGSALVEYWRNVNGGGVRELLNSPDYPNRPNEYAFLPNFEIPNNQGDDYGSRVRAYILAPETGEYTFWLAADDGGQLWLSDSENPNNKKKIAYLDEWVLPRQYDKLPQQKSAKICLEKGKKYYIEALHKEGGVDDHLSVGWQLPSGVKEMPIPGKRLFPEQPPMQLAKPSSISITITSLLPTQAGYHTIEGTFHYMGKERSFCFGLFLPDIYFSSSDKLPLIVTLHNLIGSIGGDKPDEKNMTFEGFGLLMVDDIGADKRHSGEWPVTKINPRKDMKFIGLLPQCPKDLGFTSKPMIDVVVAIIDWLEKKIQMDSDRVYLTGFSYGGTSTWAIGQSHPERFAAIVPLSARLAPSENLSPEILKDVGVWCGVGERDGNFFASCQRMTDIFTKAKHPNFHFTVIKDGGHHCYQSIYGDANFWDWLLKQKRKIKVKQK